MFENFGPILMWLGAVITLTLILDGAILWLIPRVISARAIAGPRKAAGGWNRVLRHGLNNASNCQTPMSIADALMTLCAFDVSKKPMRIQATLPQEAYWSIAFYATNTDNFYVMNDRQIRAGQFLDDQHRCTFLVCAPGSNVEPNAGEILVKATSHRGMILVRHIVDDPHDQQCVNAALEYQQSISIA